MVIIPNVIIPKMALSPSKSLSPSPSLVPFPSLAQSFYPSPSLVPFPPHLAQSLSPQNKLGERKVLSSYPDLTKPLGTPHLAQSLSPQPAQSLSHFRYYNVQDYYADLWSDSGIFTFGIITLRIVSFGKSSWRLKLSFTDKLKLTRQNLGPV